MVLGPNFTTDKAQQLQELLQLIHGTTGLEVNNKKSQAILINKPNQEYQQAVAMMGTTEEYVTHLGIYIHSDPKLGADKTYEESLSKINKKCDELAARIANLDMLTKTKVLYSSLLTMPNHIYRVYPPKEKFLISFFFF